jgi:glycosyltransferase involved in cell wall biosynthesis
MKLHLLSIPHTYTHPSFSCCAFTGKVLRFSPMMRSQGFHVIHYGNAGSNSGANEDIEILSPEEYERFHGCTPGVVQYGNSAHIGSPLYTAFNEKLAIELEKYVDPGDIICLPFGRAHVQALSGPRCQSAYWVETGIGYRNSFAKFRVFESDAWLNLTAGRENPDGVVMGNDYWWTIPNYYDENEWPLAEEFDDHSIVFLGRLNEDKGLRIIDEVAKRRPNVNFTLCGQGDPEPWLKHKNVRYTPPMHGAPHQGRAAYLGQAAATIVPSRYIEPFGGVAAESLLCGTPVITSAFGAFPEYVNDGFNGFTCRTLRDWLDAIDIAIAGGPIYTRPAIRSDAVERFSMWSVAKQYANVFEQIEDLGKGGWYSNVEA